MTTFDESAWIEQCNKQASVANAGCGLVYELYQRRLSGAIDGLVNDLPAEHQARALEIARAEFDYLSPDEIGEEIRQDMEDGYCSHGLPLDCCPVGCGDLCDL